MIVSYGNKNKTNECEGRERSRITEGLSKAERILKGVLPVAECILIAGLAASCAGSLKTKDGETEECVANRSPATCDSSRPLAEGIVTPDDPLEMGNLTLVLESTEMHAETLKGVFAIKDSCDEVLKRNHLASNETAEITIEGAEYDLTVNALHESDEQQWADVSVTVHCIDVEEDLDGASDADVEVTEDPTEDTSLDAPADIPTEEAEEDTPSEVEDELDDSADPDVTIDPDVTTDPDAESVEDPTEDEGLDDDMPADIPAEEAEGDVPSEVEDEFDAISDADVEVTEDITDGVDSEDVAIDTPTDLIAEDGACLIYSDTQPMLRISLGGTAIVGNVTIVYAEQVSTAMDRFEVSYCDGTLVDDNFRVGEFSGTNRDYPLYTFRVSIRNRGSSGGVVTADITVTDY